MALASETLHANVSRLAGCFVTFEMEAGKIGGQHFLNYVAVSPNVAPFLLRSVFGATFDSFVYREKTPKVVNEFLEQKVMVAGIEAQNLFCQHAGRGIMIHTTIDSRMKAIVIVPCSTHTLNLAFAHALQGRGQVRKSARDVQTFQNVMRRKSAPHVYGKVCPGIPET
jgi:hypothetical protein